MVGDNWSSHGLKVCPTSVTLSDPNRKDGTWTVSDGLMTDGPSGPQQKELHLLTMQVVYLCREQHAEDKH